MYCSDDLLSKLVSGEHKTRNGKVIALPTRSIVISETLDGLEYDLIKNIGFKAPFAIVSDQKTYDVLGARVERALHNFGDITSICLDSNPHADAETAETIINGLGPSSAIIAVGSGTINDLCKYVASKCNIPYAVFATAPSMNGYTSVNAAITTNGIKESVVAAMPRGVFMDLEILSKAPLRMIKSGLGDSICRPMCQTDWLMAHLLHGSYYDPTPFELLISEENKLFNFSADLINGNLNCMRALARTLNLSGIGMTICGGSYPASQGEHLISHLIEMTADLDIAPSLHGEQIGVTTLVMAKLQEHMIKAGPPRLKPSKVCRDDVITAMGAKLGSACWKEFSQKIIPEESVDLLNKRLDSIWDDLTEHVRKNSISHETLLNTLLAADAPVKYSDLGFSKDFFCTAIENARFQKNRYAFLDLAADSEQLIPESLI